MIKKATFKFFQSHKNTEVEFSEGINVFTGASDQGKSAIIKGLRWVFENEPKSNPFQSTFAKHGDVTDVKAEFYEGEWAQRRRKNTTVNEYKVSSLEDPLRSFSRDVPSEVRDVTKIEDYNIQSQHDKYFLLQDSPPEVARQFNDKAGLSIIDDIHALTKKEKRKSKMRIDDSEKNIKALKEEIKDGEHLEALGKKIDRLEKVIVSREEKRAERKATFNLCKDLKQIDDEIRIVNTWLEVKERVENLAREANICDRETYQRECLIDTVDVLNDLDERITDLKQFSFAKKELESLKATTQINNKDERELRKIFKFVTEMKNLDQDIEDLEVEISEGREELKDLYVQVEQCPTCEQPVRSKKVIDTMIGNLMEDR